MKKKLLFVTLYLQTGGVERSLLALLSAIDYTKYQVDLLLFDHSGVLFKMIPEQVNVLPPLFDTYSIPLVPSIPKLVKRRELRLLTGKVLAATLTKFKKGVGTEVRWNIYRKTLKNQNQHYDVAISYLDIYCNYYVSEKVMADKKILYNHMDYEYSQKTGWPCPKLEKQAFEKCDYIVSVADSAKKSLLSYFPEISAKTYVIHNSVSPKAIHIMAEEEKIKETNKIRIVTVARLVEEKGVLIAVKACKQLIESGYTVEWLLIGNGPLKNEIVNVISEMELQKYFILLGELSNPYPYMKNSDIYVQPSKTEAHCVAVEEALALYRPIIATDIPAFLNQLEDEVTGIIVNADIEGVAKGIKRLIDTPKLREKLSNNLKNVPERNKKEFDKFLYLVEN